jgi:DNA-binding CsgD family transcriptional regulator
VDLIEAGTRSGDRAAAAAALDSLAPVASAAGTPAALGWLALGRAMLADDDGATGGTAEAGYLLAIEHLGRSRHVPVSARARLLYGEWLRRAGRRRDAREQLRAAHEALTAMGAGPFAERAERELRATGETVRKRTLDARDELTAQEAQIALLAADGHTNPQIGAQLFLSPRTVEWHLRKVFTKLGISSRRELGPALPGPAQEAIPA